MSLQVIQLSKLREGAPVRGIADQFGSKAAGLVRLRDAQKHCTVPFRIPDALMIAAPASINGAASAVDQLKGLEQLLGPYRQVSGWCRVISPNRANVPLLLESTSIEFESPTRESPTVMLYRPTAHAVSVAAILKEIELQQAGNSMCAMLVTPIMGAPAWHFGTGWLYGMGSVFFQADPHIVTANSARGYSLKTGQRVQKPGDTIGEIVDAAPALASALSVYYSGAVAVAGIYPVGTQANPFVYQIESSRDRLNF